MSSGFEWDAKKARRNHAVHGVDFEEATTVFRDPLSATVPDESHSEKEGRWITIGMSARRRLVVVWHVDRGESIRVIGARLPTSGERRRYEEGALSAGS